MGLFQLSPVYKQAELHCHIQGVKMVFESVPRKWFGEYVGGVISPSDWLNFDFAFSAELPEIVVANIDVFYFVMVFSILCEMNWPQIVTPKNCQLQLSESYLFTPWVHPP